ncbi:hypothetical protein Glove_60g117 [Diversispora epigaea]|uniref:Uncharacterized protein n=1 Tax=Diversispora epigaea TaxID=1348612 RepID=A0A397JG44_9GLOM|nr:hypothetical protein Glove_60g117 [Diversispora epigaea]
MVSEEVAEKEHNISQYIVGNCYKNGYKSTAENGNTNGQYKLGECFYEGYGTKQDIVKAIYWLIKIRIYLPTDY